MQLGAGRTKTERARLNQGGVEGREEDSRRAGLAHVSSSGLVEAV